MKNVRMKVLKTFTRNLGGQIIAGNPKHPDEEGRILYVTEAVAVALEKDEEAKRYSLKDEARDEVAGESSGAVGNVEGARTTGTGVTNSAQQTRQTRVAKTGTAGKGRGKVTAPVGGNETTATTNHGSTSTDGTGQSEGTNNGANSTPSDEAP
jgi:hypothetical protein